MTLITLVLSAIVALLSPAPADVVGLIGEVSAPTPPAPVATPAPQDIVGPIGE